MALDIFETFATDEYAEENGVWVPLDADSELLIARDGNDECEQMVEKLMLENSAKLSGDAATAKAAQREIEIEITARTILKGWKGLQYQGETLEYSVENAKKLLQHKDFRRRVLFHARQRAAYVTKHEAEVTNN